MDRDIFLKGMEFCSTHTSCAWCPIKEHCKGAYDILPSAFTYIKELTEEIDILRSEQEQCP